MFPRSHTNKNMWNHRQCRRSPYTRRTHMDCWGKASLFLQKNAFCKVNIQWQVYTSSYCLQNNSASPVRLEQWLITKMSRLTTKPTRWLRSAKTQISLCIRPDWSDSSLCAQLVAKDPRFLHADRLIWVFAGRTCHFVGFVMRRLKWTWKLHQFKLKVHLKTAKTCNKGYICTQIY